MTPTSRTDWTMVDELVAQAGSHTPDYVDEVIAATARVRQRPAWTFPSRWLPAGAAQPHPALSPALVAALLGIALPSSGGSSPGPPRGRRRHCRAPPATA